MALCAIYVMGATAGVPQVLNYQGRVVVDGTNYHGSGDFKFAMVDSGADLSKPASAVAHRTGQFVTTYTVTDGGADIRQRRM